MKALIVLGCLHAAVAVFLAIELINHGLSSTALKCIMILAIGGVSFLIYYIESRRIAKNIVNRSGYDELKQDMEKLLQDMHKEIYGDEDEGKEPITLDSPVVGRLTYRRKPEWYEGDSKWCGSKVKVLLQVSIDKDPYAALDALEGYFKDSRKIDRILRGRVAEKKDKKLAKRIFATNVTLTSEGMLELDYADYDCQILGIYSENGMKVKIRR